jgi:NADPH2:quinone reductase
MQTTGYFIMRKGNASDVFQLKDFELGNPSFDELTIQVEAFGLNYADVMARRGLYREAPKFPAIIGYEVVGTVVAVGNEANASWIGRRVVGFTRFGGYAKRVNTKVLAVAAIEDMPAGEALALATQFVTAYYMVHRSANVQEGECALVHAAAGGVGTALIQLLKLKGACVAAKVSSTEKEELVKQLGADLTINYKKENYQDALKRWLGNERLDVSFNPVAGSTFKLDGQILGTGGRLVLFGGSELSNGKWGLLSTLNFVRKMGIVVPIGLMMRSKSIVGINMLKVADFKPKVLQQCLHAVVDMKKAGKIHPVVGAEFHHSRLSEAHQLLEDGKSTGKIMITWNE